MRYMFLKIKIMIKPKTVPLIILKQFQNRFNISNRLKIMPDGHKP